MKSDGVHIYDLFPMHLLHYSYCHTVRLHIFLAGVTFWGKILQIYFWNIQLYKENADPFISVADLIIILRSLILVASGNTDLLIGRISIPSSLNSPQSPSAALLPLPRTLTEADKGAPKTLLAREPWPGDVLWTALSLSPTGWLSSLD